MEKKSFEEIRALVTKKNEHFSNISSSYLNEEGKLLQAVYYELDTCFFADNDLVDYVENVSVCIKLLLKPEWYWSPEVIEFKKNVAEKLRRFVRFQIENELWENIPEFAVRKEN